MKKVATFVAKALFGGLLIVVPVYLAALLLFKGMSSVVGFVRPFALLLPDWFPSEKLFSLLFVLMFCFLIGVAIRTQAGWRLREWSEKTFFEKMPGYMLFRSLTEQMTGDNGHHTWKPALIQFDEALVPAFIIEVFEDGRYTVFVPSSPTPFAGNIYILDSNRVHPLNVSFTEVVKVIAQWGLGAKELVAVMEKDAKVSK